MRLFNHVITVRRVEGQSLESEIKNIVLDADREIRPLIAKMARSAAKDYLEQLKEDAK